MLEAVAAESDTALRESLARLEGSRVPVRDAPVPDISTFKRPDTRGRLRQLLHDRRRLLHTAIVAAMEHQYAGPPW